MTNINLSTGIRFGVISMQALDGDLQQELFYGPQAVDVSYNAAYCDARVAAELEWAGWIDEAAIAADEVDPNMNDTDREWFIENHLVEHQGVSSEEDHVDHKLEEFNDCYVADEPTIDGEYEGVKYHISWLGGAPILYVFEGPVGFAASLCSLCVPNAADLDAGWNEFETTDTDNAIEYVHECYVVPRDWLAKEAA